MSLSAHQFKNALVFMSRNRKMCTVSIYLEMLSIRCTESKMHSMHFEGTFNSEIWMLNFSDRLLSVCHKKK